ncbi:unnamed protein product [Schistosoma margrebowiei]|uniref:Uncharacterized protein n=1 Tax=Schistosoma margrebowiei TaxID=48269 RepID=A0A183LUD0_9TREM|nr:unnamed protein product [Schistosoma margrebowiei]
MPLDKSRDSSEITKPIPLLTIKETLFLSTWNIRTVWKIRKTGQIATEMKRYKLAVLGIRKTHWTQTEQQRLDMGEMLLYSVHEDENVPHTRRIALMLTKEARNTLVGWESHGCRIMKAPLETKKEGYTMNVIQCYAPTNGSNDDKKDQFYERLWKPSHLTRMPYTHQQMQVKTSSVEAASASVGLNIHKGKSNILKYNTENTYPITIHGETLENVKSFTFLGSIIDEKGGSYADVKARVGEARTTFPQL